MGILGKLLGSDAIISTGLKLIDDLVETDAEERASKTKAKIDLMTAYAPFKIAQRYLALMFGGSFLACFWLCIGMALTGQQVNVDVILEIMKVFMMPWIMTSIIIFYFGGGLTESVGIAVSNGKGK